MPASAWADEAESLYTTDAVGAIELEIPPSSIAALEADPTGEYQPAQFKFADTDGTPGGVGAYSAPIEVSVRLKGHVNGSFEPLSGKAAFKIKFKKSTPFRGLKKMTLNNMVEDRSMIHEALTYTAFRAAGVPAPRTGYAFLRVNGEPYGVYLDIETLDKVALEKQLGPFDEETQHLYEGEYGADVVPGGAGAFEVDEGDEEDRSDLEALIAAVNAPSPPSYSERMAPVADLAELTRMWAVEKYIGRWDGYAGFHRSVNQPNNYYLYSDAAGRFQMLPWGSDETWEMYYRLPFDEPDGLMFDKCLEDEACFGEYWKAVSSTSTTIAGLPLDALATHLASVLQPWQALDPRKPTSTEEIAAAVAEVRQFIAVRPGDAAVWLADNAPAEIPSGTEEPPLAGGPALVSGSTPAPLVSGSSSTTTPAPRIHLLGPIEERGRHLHLEVRLSTPGWVRLDSERGSGLAEGAACFGARRFLAAGRRQIGCRISALTWRRLKSRSLSVTLRARFEAEAGPDQEAVRTIELHKRT